MVEVALAAAVVAAMAIVVGVVFLLRTLRRFERLADQTREIIERRIPELIGQAQGAVGEVSRTAQDVRLRTESLGRVLREAETIIAVLGMLFGAKEVISPSLGSLLGTAVKRALGIAGKQPERGGEGK